MAVSASIEYDSRRQTLAVYVGAGGKSKGKAGRGYRKFGVAAGAGCAENKNGGRSLGWSAVCLEISETDLDFYFPARYSLIRNREIR